jgi:hypothetical protein
MDHPETVCIAIKGGYAIVNKDDKPKGAKVLTAKQVDEIKRKAK